MREIIIFCFCCLLLSACCFDGRMDSFEFIVKNNCNYTVSSIYKRPLSKITKEDYPKIPPGFETIDGGRFHIGCYDDYEEIEKRHNSFGNTIHILYPGGHEEILTTREFAAKADAQTGKEGRGFWTLTLCPDNENPPPPGEMIWPSPSSSY